MTPRPPRNHRDASLRNRVAITLAMFGAVVSLGLATVIYFASHDLEARLIDDTLKAELEDYIARRSRNPRSLPEQTATIRAYVVTEEGGARPPPPEVVGLPLGSASLQLDGVDYLSLSRKAGPQRFVVLYDTTALQHRERGFLLLLAGSVLLVTLAAAMAGRWLAGRLIAPVNDLVRRVSELHPEDEPVALEPEFPWAEVRQLAADFDAYLRRLHDFHERERLFTGDISHELRTPIAVIQGAADLLLLDPKIDGRNRSRLQRIARAVAEMGEISRALLALARERDDPGISAAAQAEPILEELRTRFDELYRQQEIGFRLERIEPCASRVEPAAFSMVLTNLLRNAANATREAGGGEVLISTTKDAVWVTDQGGGLPSQPAEQLFRPYVRGPNSQGAGLGLSLVQRLCDRQGWSIALEDGEGHGARAILRLAPPAE